MPIATTASSCFDAPLQLPWFGQEASTFCKSQFDEEFTTRSCPDLRPRYFPQSLPGLEVYESQEASRLQEARTNSRSWSDFGDIYDAYQKLQIPVQEPAITEQPHCVEKTHEYQQIDAADDEMLEEVQNWFSDMIDGLQESSLQETALSLHHSVSTRCWPDSCEDLEYSDEEQMDIDDSEFMEDYIEFSCNIGLDPDDTWLYRPRQAFNGVSYDVNVSRRIQPFIPEPLAFMLPPY